MIGSANLTGTVPCALIEEHELRTLMMSSNKLEGTLPACVLEVSWPYFLTWQSGNLCL